MVKNEIRAGSSTKPLLPLDAGADSWLKGGDCLGPMEHEVVTGARRISPGPHLCCGRPSVLRPPTPAQGVPRASADPCLSVGLRGLCEAASPRHSRPPRDSLQGHDVRKGVSRRAQRTELSAPPSCCTTARSSRSYGTTTSRSSRWERPGSKTPMSPKRRVEVFLNLLCMALSARGAGIGAPRGSGASLPVCLAVLFWRVSVWRV